ncbi:MAG: hypothetical protein WDO18_22980 [Acidobacteriota bacterium]
MGRRAATWRFFPPDFEKFPLLKLAYKAQEAGGSATAIVNAADEIAVARVSCRPDSLPRNLGDGRRDTQPHAGA